MGMQDCFGKKQFEIVDNIQIQIRNEHNHESLKHKYMTKRVEDNVKIWNKNNIYVKGEVRKYTQLTFDLHHPIYTQILKYLHFQYITILH